MARKISCALLLLLLLTGESLPYSYRRNPATMLPPSTDTEYDSLTAKFPGHSRVISKLYADYSGWIIPLAENYGISPLLAVYGSDDAGAVLPVLWRDIEIFADIHEAIGGLVLPENVRAVTALDILSAFTVRDSVREAEYSRAIRSARQKDSRSGFTGRKANYYARKIPGSSAMPENFLRTLKASYPDAYSRLIHEISQADYDTLKACCDFPDAFAFLMKTGRTGAALIDGTGGKVLPLVMILPDDERMRLPEIFRRYHGLNDALKFCGAESFFTVMICPELFFSLTDILDGTSQERFTLAYAFILFQAESGNVDFLKGLSPSQARTLARYTAEMMYSDSAGYVPLKSPMFPRFVLRYGDDAADICREFGAFVDVADLFVNGWSCDTQDISPVIEAVKSWGVMGLQAAIHFRHMRKIQSFILTHPNAARRSELLMFMLYDDASGHKYTERIASIDEGAAWMLKNYRADSKTGEPIPVNDDGGLLKYVPGHDSVGVLYNWWKYGRTPSVSEAIDAAIEIVNVIELTHSLVNFAVNVAQGTVKTLSKEMLIDYAKEKIIDELPEFIGSYIEGYIDGINEAPVNINIIVADMFSPDMNTSGKSPLVFRNEDTPAIMGRGIGHEGMKLLLGHLGAR